MTKYRVGLVQTVWEEATVYIEAENPEQAMDLAIAQGNNGDVHWRFMETAEPIEAVSVEETKITA